MSKHKLMASYRCTFFSFRFLSPCIVKWECFYSYGHLISTIDLTQLYRQVKTKCLQKQNQKRFAFSTSSNKILATCHRSDNYKFKFALNAETETHAIRANFIGWAAIGCTIDRADDEQQEREIELLGILVFNIKLRCTTHVNATICAFDEMSFSRLSPHRMHESK